MKNTLLAFALFMILGFSKLNAQIVNNDFEQWKLDTFYLPADTIGTLPADTVSFNEPIGWTSSNFVTALDSFGGKLLVTQSSGAYTGLSAIQMVTDTIILPPGLISLPLPYIFLPGFAINGVFPLGPKTFTSSSQINPGAIPGAGQPIAQRLSDIKGWFNYAPKYNAGTQANDTCVVWAVLRKGKTIVANAIFKSTDSTGTYMPFSANFQYVSCEMPDTLVVFLSSSAPNVYTFIPGSSSIVPGSKLLVDDISYDTLATGYTFAPFAQNDIYTVYEYHTDTFNVLANDTDCSGQGLTVSIVSGPHHGTATVLANNSIKYTPTVGFLGLDSIFYSDLNVNSGTAQALCQVFVTTNSGIEPLTEVSVNLHPVPANNELNVQFENPGKCSGKIYDLVGNLVLSTELNGNINNVNIQNLSNGMYAFEILNAQNAVIGRSKFVVVK